MSIANYFTLFRIFISPIFLLVYLEHTSWGISSVMLPYVLLFLLGMSEFSDAFDGFIARRYGQVTDLGKVLDPMADSIYRISVFLTFTLDPVRLPLLLIFIFIYRDSVISTLRTMCAYKGYILAARLSGKIKAVIQALASFAILVLMIPHALGRLSTSHLQLWSSWIVAGAAVYTILSGIDYIVANRYFIAQAFILPKR